MSAEQLLLEILAHDGSISRALALAKVNSIDQHHHQQWKARQTTWDDMMNRARAITAKATTGTSQENQQ